VLNTQREGRFRWSILTVPGILINAYYYFGLGGAFVALIIAILLEPILSADTLGTFADEEN
jgi:hypothetical protein